MKKRFAALAMAVSLAMVAGCGNGQGNAPATASPATSAVVSDHSKDMANKDGAKDATDQESEAKDSAGENPSSEAAGAMAGDPSASTWPGGTVQLYVPAAAGGGSDMIARVFAQAMSEETGGNFVVVNDATGGGSVAAETVRNGKTDGLNLYLGHTGLCGSIAIGQYNHTFEEFQILGTITVPGRESNIICINSSLPYETLEELIEAAKAEPGKFLVGVQANGNRHFMQMLLQKNTGTEFTIVDCGGVADTITNLVGGMVDMAILPVKNASQYIEVGDLKGLAVTGNERSELAPDIPTMKECGYESAEISSVSMLAGPLGMSEDDVAKINQTMKTVLENPNVVEQYTQLAMDAGYMTPEDSAAIIAEMQQLYNDAAAEMNK